MTVPSVMRPTWLSHSRRSRSISAEDFFLRPNSRYAAKTALAPPASRVYKRNGNIFLVDPGADPGFLDKEYGGKSDQGRYCSVTKGGSGKNVVGSRRSVVGTNQ